MRKVFFALISCALLAGPAVAQSPAPPITDRAETNETVSIVVTAPTPQAIQSFVTSFASAPQYAYQMGRWDQRICPGVVGLHRDQAQFIVDRIAFRAHQVALRPGQPGCRANIAIFVTPDAGLLAHNLVHSFGRWMDRYPDNYVKTSGQQALEEFETSGQPVRWWHVSEMTQRSGQHLHDAHISPVGARLSPSTGLSGNLTFSAPVVHMDGTRLRRSTQQEFQRVIIVVDARQAQGIALQSLADYLAMVSLAQINPNEEVGTLPTILNLFNRSTSTTYVEMTAWDQAYLRGVYHMERTADMHFQRADIARTMQRAFREPPTETPEPTSPR